MNLKPFKFKDYEALMTLLRSQNYPDVESITYQSLPKVGYIAYLGKEPIAAGFLRRLEPCYGQIDTLASNGFFGSQIRHEGITKVVDALLADADTLKLKGLMATTSDQGVLSRSQTYGFRIVNQSIIAKILK